MIYTSSNDIFRNDYQHSIIIGGITYPTVEHAFQAAKTDDKDIKRTIADAGSVRKARKIGRTVTLIPGWDDRRVTVMECLLREKFRNGDLSAQLIDTGDEDIIADLKNDFWGVGEDGSGANVLGSLLERIRTELQFKVGYVQKVSTEKDERDLFKVLEGAPINAVTAVAALFDSADNLLDFMSKVKTSADLDQFLEDRDLDALSELWELLEDLRTSHRAVEQVLKADPAKTELDDIDDDDQLKQENGVVTVHIS